jgi:ABC-2 type transport system ATP-binding protein
MESMNTAENVIEAEGLVKHRGDFTLGPLTLHIPRGFVTGVVGANGSGKTTTLRTVLGLMHADKGTIALPPMDTVGVAFDQPFLLPDWRVRDAAAAYAAFKPHWDQAHFERLCARFAIDPEDLVKDLSRGEGNKLMIALAMGNHPSLLVLDEPTSGLDPASRADLIDLFRKHMRSEDASLIFSTHITSDLESFADYLVFIDGGQVVDAGPLDEFLESYAYVHGALKDLNSANTPLIRGLRKNSHTFDGIIRTADSAAFPASVQIDAPTIEQIVVHHQQPSKEF